MDFSDGKMFETSFTETRNHLKQLVCNIVIAVQSLYFEALKILILAGSDDLVLNFVNTPFHYTFVSHFAVRNKFIALEIQVFQCDSFVGKVVIDPKVEDVRLT